MNNKGFTVVELIITFVIVMTISLGLFITVDSYRERQQQEMYKKELESYKNTVLKLIQNDITRLGLDKLNKLDIFSYEVGGEKICKDYDQGLELEFKNHSKKVLCFGNTVVDDKATLLYGDKIFVSPSKFVKFEQDIIDSENAEAYSFIYFAEVNSETSEFKSSILSKKVYSVNIKILHEELKSKTYLNIVTPTLTSTQYDKCNVILTGHTLTMDVQKYNKCASEVLAVLGNKITTLVINNPEGKDDLISHVSYLDSVEKIIINGDIKGISDNAFKTENGLKTVDLSGVSDSANLGAFLFENTNIEKLIIKDNKKTAYETAFQKIGVIKELEIKYNGDELISTISSSLKGKVEKLNIGDSRFKVIEEHAFSSFGLKEVEFSDLVNKIGEFSFYGNMITEVDFSNLNNLYVDTSAFEGNPIKKIISSEKMTYIGDYAFYGSVVIGELYLDAIYIGHYNFNNVDNSDPNMCFSTGITKLTFGNSVQKIGNYSFVCAKTTEIYIPEGVIEIGAFAFDNVTGIIHYKKGTKLGECFALHATTKAYI